MTIIYYCEECAKKRKWTTSGLRTKPMMRCSVCMQEAPLCYINQTHLLKQTKAAPVSPKGEPQASASQLSLTPVADSDVDEWEDPKEAPKKKPRRTRKIEKIKGPLVMDETAQDVVEEEPAVVAEEDILDLTAEKLASLKEEGKNAQVKNILRKILSQALKNPKEGQFGMWVDNTLVENVSEELRSRKFAVEVSGEMVSKDGDPTIMENCSFIRILW